MQVNQIDMDAWAMRALHVNGCLIQTLTAIEKGDLESARYWAQLAREENWITERGLVEAGAADPIYVRQLEAERDLPEEERSLLVAPERYDLAALDLGGGRGAGE